MAGHLSLALVAVLFAIPLLPRTLASYKIASGLAVLLLVLVFALRGIRFGRGIGKVAAWLALTILTVTMIASVVINTYRNVVEVSHSIKPGR